MLLQPQTSPSTLASWHRHLPTLKNQFPSSRNPWRFPPPKPVLHLKNPQLFSRGPFQCASYPKKSAEKGDVRGVRRGKRAEFSECRSTNGVPTSPQTTPHFSSFSPPASSPLTPHAQTNSSPVSPYSSSNSSPMSHYFISTPVFRSKTQISSPMSPLLNTSSARSPLTPTSLPFLAHPRPPAVNSLILSVPPLCLCVSVVNIFSQSAIGNRQWAIGDLLTFNFPSPLHRRYRIKRPPLRNILLLKIRPHHQSFFPHPRHRRIKFRHLQITLPPKRLLHVRKIIRMIRHQPQLPSRLQNTMHFLQEWQLNNPPLVMSRLRPRIRKINVHRLQTPRRHMRPNPPPRLPMHNPAIHPTMPPQPVRRKLRIRLGPLNPHKIHPRLRLTDRQQKRPLPRPNLQLYRMVIPKNLTPIQHPRLIRHRKQNRLQYQITTQSHLRISACNLPTFNFWILTSSSQLLAQRIKCRHGAAEWGATAFVQAKWEPVRWRRGS